MRAGERQSGSQAGRSRGPPVSSEKGNRASQANDDTNHHGPKLKLRAVRVSRGRYEPIPPQRRESEQHSSQHAGIELIRALHLHAPRWNSCPHCNQSGPDRAKTATYQRLAT